MASLGLQPTYHAGAQAQTTESDVRRDRRRDGQCINCGYQTHNVSRVTKSRVPITDEYSLRGRCLICKPLEDPASASAPGEAPEECNVAAPSDDGPSPAEPAGIPLNDNAGATAPSSSTTTAPPQAPMGVQGSDQSAATSVHDSWLKQYQRWVIGGFFLISTVVAAILGVTLSSKTKPLPPLTSTPIPATPIPIEPLGQTPEPVTPTPTLRPNPNPATQIPIQPLGLAPESVTPTPTLRPNPIPATQSPIQTSGPTPGSVTPTPTPRPNPIPTAELQASSLELVANQDIISHLSDKNVAIYGDTAIFGAPSNDSYRGCAFVFVRDENGAWALQYKLIAPDGAAMDWFGWSVGIYADTVIVGAFRDDGNVGSAHIFVRDGFAWSHQDKLLAPDGAAEDWFGYSVGIYADTAIVGAHMDDDNVEDRGSAHIFVRDGFAWSPQDKLLALDGAAGDLFGYSVGIYGDTVIVGAHMNEDNGSDSGSAYLFVRNGITWSQQDKLSALDGAAGDRFGGSVGIYGDTVIVGVDRDDDNVGSAHIYVRNGITWSQQDKLLAPDGAVGDRFGVSVGIYGDTVIVGAYWDDGDDGEDNGSVHLFVRNGATWTPRARLVAPKSGQSHFGQSVGIYNGTTICGSGSKVYAFSG